MQVEIEKCISDNRELGLPDWRMLIKIEHSRNRTCILGPEIPRTTTMLYALGCTLLASLLDIPIPIVSSPLRSQSILYKRLWRWNNVCLELRPSQSLI